MEQVQALNAQLPARIRPLVPVAIAMALAVFLVIPGPLLRAFALGMVCGPILLAGVAVGDSSKAVSLGLGQHN
jgi:hypothetical protein